MKNHCKKRLVNSSLFSSWILKGKNNKDEDENEVKRGGQGNMDSVTQIRGESRLSMQPERKGRQRQRRIK